MSSHQRTIPASNIAASLGATLSEIGAAARVEDVVNILRRPLPRLDLGMFTLDPDGYVRHLLHRDERFEALIIGWLPGQFSEIHDHGGAECAFRVLRGMAVERRYESVHDSLAREVSRDVYLPGSVVACVDDDIHSMGADADASDPLFTLHVYRPEPVMRVYQLAAGVKR
ncbi:MAG: hypothetical protein EA379_10165 [Phycisphaerales bacterium]|nr:MAG: hypothetical protein EA379_10165 [Phycisphaerales bacterium]